jgi:hypothetical protein
MPWQLATNVTRGYSAFLWRILAGRIYVLEELMKAQEEQRTQLVSALAGKGAHVDFDSAIAHFPLDLRGKKPDGSAHTAWQLLEHMRITVADILSFCLDSNYKEPAWPEDYWPKTAIPPDKAAWDRSIAAFRHDLKSIQGLVADPARDLYSKIPHGDGQTLFREALLVVDHNSYHLGQLVNVRQSLGAWPPAK